MGMYTRLMIVRYLVSRVGESVDHGLKTRLQKGTEHVAHEPKNKEGFSNKAFDGVHTTSSTGRKSSASKLENFLCYYQTGLVLGLIEV